ncbi:MAG: Asp-tRNA(Asn)/Glu-tRNA(Gln) amidotransferase subunit GatB [Patescibacteria group bacterium]|nr:Asp-tRNA(Asn)/Glu-tRNA(Gln) amidotransferase subunit GatB [Patescibacteria group bacterium]
MSYLPTIGLEIHVGLKTRTKMFCACLNDPDEKHPNINVCPVCLGHPGTLPTINKKAVDAVIKLGLALGGKVAADSHFDRKSYFYPDLPKGYQISQHEEPLITGGILKGIRIRRIHLEEDAGRLLHESSSTDSGEPASLVDFNRAGVPLMELVTEPDIKNADEAVAFARELRLIVRYLGISDADMEKGNMRIEANMSLSANQQKGTKVEVKNINSFKAVHSAIRYELERQEEILKKGGKISQETRGWDETKQKTVSQRSKEKTQDYRYFPEPDLPPLDLKEFDIESIKVSILELPEAKRHRFVQEFGFNIGAVETLIENKETADFFEAAASELKSKISNTDYKILYNYFTSDLRGIMNEKGTGIDELKITPEHFAHLAAITEKGELSSRLAKKLLLKMFETGDDPEVLKREEGMDLISNEQALELVVKKIIENNPKPVEDYKKGKEQALQFLIGQVMAKTKGQASPSVVAEVFKKLLK